MRPQLSALRFDDHLPFICSELKQATKPARIYLLIQVLYWYCSISTLFLIILKSLYVLSAERSIIFSEAFQFDILNIPLSVQVRHEQPCYLKKRCACAKTSDCVPAALIGFTQTWVQFFHSLHHLQTLSSKLKSLKSSLDYDWVGGGHWIRPIKIAFQVSCPSQWQEWNWLFKHFLVMSISFC